MGASEADGPASDEPLDDASRAARADHTRDTQRARLLAAVVEVAAEHGYERATVARLITHAGVSRATFYEHFPDSAACLLAAHSEIDARLLGEIRDRIAGRPPQHAAAGAIGALLAFADREPAAARILTNETLAAGPLLRRARDESIAAAAAIVEQAYRDLPEDEEIPDLPSEILLGAVQRMLASRLRRAERALLTAEHDLLGWLAAYTRPRAEHRWRTLSLSPPATRSPFVAESPLRAPPALRPGRARHSTSAVTENHRLRIIFATAEVVQLQGYLNTSATEISRAAGLDGHVFYELFADKQDAFMAVHEFAFQRAMAITAGAFFAGEDWPARIWEAARAFTGHLEQNPTLTHSGLIESHAGGPDTVQRLEDLMAGFTIFLQEGYQYETATQPGTPSAVALEAVAAANVEALYRQARVGVDARIAGLLPHLTYVCLTPFVGPARAGELIGELARTQSERDSRQREAQRT